MLLMQKCLFISFYFLFDLNGSELWNSYNNEVSKMVLQFYNAYVMAYSFDLF